MLCRLSAARTATEKPLIPCRMTNQWWNRRIPVKHMVMLYLSQVSITLSSRMEPPGCATYCTPERLARSMLSPNGKNASLPSETPLKVASHAFFYSLVRGSGFVLKNCSQTPSASTSS